MQCFYFLHFNYRWLVAKDSFVAYIRPRDGMVCDVMLMDSDFKVDTGMSATGAHHGLLISNLSRLVLFLMTYLGTCKYCSVRGSKYARLNIFKI